MVKGQDWRPQYKLTSSLNTDAWPHGEAFPRGEVCCIHVLVYTHVFLDLSAERA